MAPSNLTSVSSILAEELFTSFVNRELSTIDKLLALPRFFSCEYDDEYGCGELAIVTDLDTEREFCLKHFHEVSR